MTNSSEILNAIKAADEAFVAAFAQGDAASVAALYTETGQILPPNSDFVTGRQGIQALFQGLMNMGIKAIKLEALEIEEYGDTATEVGKYILAADGDQVLDQGKLIVIWKREAGQWKLHRDIFNSSLPVPQ